MSFLLDNRGARARALLGFLKKHQIHNAFVWQKAFRNCVKSRRKPPKRPCRSRSSSRKGGGGVLVRAYLQHLAIYLSVHLSVCLSICLSIRLGLYNRNLHKPWFRVPGDSTIDYRVCRLHASGFGLMIFGYIPSTFAYLGSP